MIVRTPRHDESFIRRILRNIRTSHVAGFPLVQPQDQFEVEIAKETNRSNRRSTGREFALVMLGFSDRNVDERKLFQLAKEFSRRLRISDTLGWYDFRLTALLPETDKDGAMVVANELSRLAVSLDVHVDTEVSVYPWDDRLGSSTASESSRSSGDNNTDDDNTDENGGMFRTDSMHAQRGPHTPVAGNKNHQGEQPLTRGGLKGFSGGAASSTTAILEPAVAASPRTRATESATGNKITFHSERTPVWKRALDIFGASTGIVLLSPVFVGAAIAIKISSPGPILFRQQREGKDGKPFGILKFRTMVVDAETKQANLRAISEQDGPAFKLKNDPRVTSIGRKLRKSCIDELPQLFNVLMGQMSLVGPRPLPVGESQQCEAWQRQRLTILPGCTCIWQAHGGRDIPFAEWMRMDMEYIRKRSLLFDLKLILETACLTLLQRGSV